MTMQRFLIIMLLILAAHAVNAQHYDGYVISDDNKPLKGVSVILLDTIKQTLSFTRTKGDGKFEVNHADTAQAGYIVLSCMGYERDTIGVRTMKQGDTYMLYSKTFEMKEVKVTARRIRERGDTLNYSINSFMQKQDRKLSDVLKNMPGITVQSDGRIMFEGKPINKFYIEGMDLMGNNYSVASENLAAKKVKKVQVLKNHQPIKMLRDMTFSESAALNIVLQEDAKNIFQFTGDLSIGTTLQGKAKIIGNEGVVGMLFSKKKQSFNVYKFDNTGENLNFKQEAIEMMERMKGTHQSQIISDLSTLAPNIDDTRSRFNRSHLFNSNWLWKVKGGNDMRLQLNAYTERTKGSLIQRTRYKDIENLPEQIEERRVMKYSTRLRGDIQYKVNGEKVYFDNNLRIAGMFGHSNSSTMLNGEGVKQYVRPGELDITDNLYFRHKLKSGKDYSLNTSLGYNLQPGKLLLLDNTFQTHTLQTFMWKAGTGYQKRISFFTLSCDLSANITARSLKLKNTLTDISHNYLTTYTSISPTLTYNRGMLRTSLSLPVGLDTRSYNKMNKEAVTLRPGLSVVLKPIRDVELSGSYKYNMGISDYMAVDTISLFSTYTMINKGMGRFNRTYGNVVSLQTTYRNLLGGFFASLLCQYTASYNSIVYAREYSDGFFYSHATDLRSNNYGWYLLGRAEKSFSWGHSLISSMVSMMHNNYMMMYGGSLLPAMYSNKSFSLSLRMQPLEWFSFTLSNALRDTRQGGRHGNDLIPKTSFQTYTLNGNIYFMPGEWQFEVRNSFEHSTHEGIPNVFFTDIGLSWRPKNYELGLQVRNLWGKNEYTTSVVSNLQYSFSYSQLRNREILLRFAFNM